MAWHACSGCSRSARPGNDRGRPAWCDVTGDAYERFRRDYAPAFLQYLSERGEPGRRSAYELGRRAIGEQLSVLDLARIHHGMLLDVLKTHRTPDELEHIAQAASEFLVEALAVFEMTQRGFAELLSTVRADQDHARQGRAEPEQRTIERATGVLMERHGLSADTAAERIRQTAAHEGIAVLQAAADLLRRPRRQRR
jgi:ANTAR domain/Phosphoserine phosphatase RsbU, N-terminal domain